MTRTPRRLNRPPLTIDQILARADAFRDPSGRWPHREDGSVGLPDGNRSSIDQCLKLGLRGLNRGSSIAKLLRQRRGRRHKGMLPRLSRSLILKRADAHHARAGEWPHQKSGTIADAPGETWAGVNAALQIGGRGIPDSNSRDQVLHAERWGRNHLALNGVTLNSTSIVVRNLKRENRPRALRIA